MYLKQITSSSLQYYNLTLSFSLSLYIYTHYVFIILLEYAEVGSLYAFLNNTANDLEFEGILEWAIDIALGK